MLFETYKWTSGIKVIPLFFFLMSLLTQISLDLNGPEGTLALRTSSADQDASATGCVFDGEGVESLMDLRWHKVALSVQNTAASLHVDCSSIETRPLEPRGRVPITGHTLMFMRANNAAPVEVQWSVYSLSYLRSSLFGTLVRCFKVHPIWKYENI